MNVLILSCGTRVKLLEYFKNSKDWDKVVATDCSEDAPALLVADKPYIVPRMTEPGYLDGIVEICKSEEIDMVIPLQEDELVLIADNLEIFEKNEIKVAISDKEKIRLCKDKLLLAKELDKLGYKAVETYTAKEYLAQKEDDMDVYVKPRFGAGSVDTYHVTDGKLLEALVKSSDTELIVQPAVKGNEYGIDIYTDMISGEVITCFCKKKIRMRAGETEKSLSVIIPELEKTVADAVQALKLKGPLDMDVMEEDGKYYILEINPRFGGGYPHAYGCGVDFMKYLAVNAGGEANAVQRNNYKENVLAMKYSDILFK